MKKIRRIYVTHFGSETAWYDKALFDLTDPDTREAVDTVFNLENGGGKTTLMSFIFSCFEPDERRWIQHLRKSDRKFQDYFVNDGRPAVIMIEWDMPEKSAGAGRYQLTMGQVVGMIDTKDRGLRPDRHYFAFESLDGLSFDDVPILDAQTIAPVRNTGELVAWLHAQRSYGVSVTKVQSDWVDELANRRNIDVELLQRQVDFNSAEGGMDEGFLKFKTEEEFLRLFLGLTLSPTRCTKVRQAVAESVQQQGNRPKLKARLTAMERIKTAIAPLVERFGELSSAEGRCAETKARAAALRDEIGRLGDARAESARQIGEQRKAHADNYDLHVRSERSAGRDHIAMVGLQHQRQAKNAAERKVRADQDEKSAKERMDQLLAARVYWQASAAKLRWSELEATVDLAKEGLEKSHFVNDAHHNGALFHAFLTLQVGAVQNQAKDDEKTAGEQAKLATELRTQRSQADRELRAAQGQHAEATAALAAGDRERNALLTAGLLMADDPAAQVAINRHKAAADEARSAQRALEENLQDWGERAEACEHDVRREKDAQTRHERDAVEPKRSFRAGTELWTAIRDNALIQRVVESDIVDPDSGILPKALADHAGKLEQALRENTIEAAQINEDKGSIEETGLAGRNHDVEMVTRRLIDGGVQSARPANTYLADIQRDAGAARSLLLSDPAHHLGVTVASGEWGKAVSVLADLGTLPSRPITVGVNRAVASASRDQQITVGPSNDALINRPAAMALLDQVNQRLLANGRKKEELQAASEECRTSAESVRCYQRDFGRDKVEAFHLQFTRLEAEALACKARADEALNQARMLRDQIKVEQPKVAEFARKASHADADAGRVRRYQEHYEGEREQRLSEQTKAQSEMDRLGYRIGDLDHQAQVAHGASVDLRASAKQHLEQAANLSSEAERITHRKSSADLQRLLAERPRSLEELREAYRSAADLLNLEERNRIGAAVFERDKARDSYTTLRAQLKKEHAGISDDVCEGFKGQDFDAEIPRQKLATNLAHSGALNAQHEASSTKAQLDSFWSMQKERVMPLPHMEEASDIDLERMIAEAKGRAEQFARSAARDKDLEQTAAKEEERHSRAAEAHRSARSLLTTAMDLQGVAAGTAERIPDGDSGEDLAKDVIREFQTAEKARLIVEKRAHEAFTQYQKASKETSVVEAEPEVANSISSSTFDQARTDVDRLSHLIEERLAVVRSSLEKLDGDLQGVAEELYSLTYDGMRLFQHALSKNLPTSAPWVGGKAFMTTAVNHMGMSVPERKAIATNYLHDLISNKISGRGDLPLHGAHMAARCLLAMSGKPALGLKLLTMEQNPEHQFRPVGSLKVSDGQGSVIAMFIYLLISQLRADTQVKGGERAGGGPLFLDNPFAKVQTKALIDIQRQVAAAADVQLVFFTANGDPNILSGFPRMIRMKKAGMSPRSGRSHVEFVSCSPADPGEVS